MGQSLRGITDPPPSHLHEAFLERAADPENGSGGQALGAFLTMRLVDHFAVDGHSHHEALEYQARSTADFLRNLHPQNSDVAQLREIARIAQAALDSGKRRLVWSPMLAYAYWLEQQLRFEEALDVLETALRLSDGRDAEDELAAFYHRGRVLRKSSRYDEATASYTAAGEAAMRMGNKHMEFRSRIGNAIVLEKIGNLPEAAQVLDSVIEEAITANDSDAEARARHDLANTLMMMNHPAKAIPVAYRAYELYEPQQQRLRALSDLGMAFKMMGDLAAAEDAFGIVLDAEVCTVEIRINVMLELLHVAALTGNRMGFARWQRALSELEARMIPDARTDFDLKLGIGFAVFGNRSRARQLLEAAVARAEEHHLNAYLFQAEAELKRLDEEPELEPDEAPTAPTAAQDEETRQVADRLRALRGGGG